MKCFVVAKETHKRERLSFSNSLYQNMLLPHNLCNECSNSSVAGAVVGGRIKPALEGQGRHSQRRECLNQDMKGLWTLPVGHQGREERKGHAKAGRSSTFGELQRV